MTIGSRSLPVRACCGVIAALGAAWLVPALADAGSHSVRAISASSSSIESAGSVVPGAGATRGVRAVPVPGMYATDNAGNFFLINLSNAAPALITVGYACSALGAKVTELEYNNDTHQGIVQNSASAFSFNTLDFATGLPSGPTTGDGAALLGMEWVHGTLLATAIPAPGLPSSLVKLNPTTGATATIGLTGLSNISGLAWHEPTHTLYGVTAHGLPSDLVTIDISTGTATVVANTGVILGSLEFGPDGRLYGGGGQANANELYDIDRITGQARYIGNTGLGANAITGLALVEEGRDFYAVNNLASNFGYPGDTLVRFRFDDPATFITIGPILDTGGVALYGLGGLDFNYDGSVLYASDSFGAAGGTIYTIDPATAQATSLGTLAGNPSISDLAWDPLTHDLYGVDSNTNTLWANVDDPPNAVSLGPFSGAGLLNVGLAFDAFGNLYVHDVVSDSIYFASAGALTTLTLLHALAYDSNFSQGLFVDWSRDSWGYHGAFNNSAFLSEDYLVGTLVTGGGYGPLTGTFPLDPGGSGFPLVEVGDLARMPLPPCGFVNPSFETGDFTAWFALDLVNPFFPLVVDPSSGLNTFGWTWGSLATDGAYTAFHGFDGDGASSGYPIKIAQNVWIGDNARLSFDWRAAWDLVNFCGGCADRRFDVVVRSSVSGLELKRVNVLTAKAGTFVFDTGRRTGSIGLREFRGQLVNVCFEWAIPDDDSGPGQFQLDNICLAPPCVGDINGDGITDVFDFALFARAFEAVIGDPNYNPDADLDGDGVIGVFDFAIFAVDFECPYS